MDQLLCKKCSLIELYAPKKDTTIRRYTSLAELVGAADAGCAFCRLVRTGHEAWDHGSHDEMKVIEISHGSLPRRDTETEISWTCRRKGGVSSNVLGEVYAHPDDLASQYIGFRPLAPDPRSPESEHLIRSWLEECDTSHPECAKLQDVALPTRIIDVGAAEVDTDPRLHIPLTGAKGKYAALSYCWGKSNTATLTKGNLAEMVERIPMAKLPATIRDAVQVARKMGFRYLWVDALCILQDSLEDWEKESAQMGDIYGRAAITLQAAGAQDVSEGFFIPRTRSNPYDGFPVPGRPELPPQPPVKLPFVDDHGHRGTVYIRFGRTPDEAVLAPAQRRSWICQENHLSSRLLSFGTYKLYWACRTAYRDECGATCFDFGFFPGLPKPLRASVPLFQGDEEDLSPAEKIWSFLVQEYCHRRLSVPRDKLPGLSGIVAKIAPTRPGDKYLAGMWMNDMPASLTWTVALERDPSTGGRLDGPLKEYRAPSWSWAAWDGSITPYRYGTVTDGVCKVVEASVVQSGHNPYGEVSAGSLTIRGLVKEAWRVRSSRYQFTQIIEQVDPLPPADSYLDVTKGLVSEDYEDPESPEETPRETCFIRIHEKKGLALERLDDGNYRRIGTFSLQRERTWESLEGWFTEQDLRVITIV